MLIGEKAVQSANGGAPKTAAPVSTKDESPKAASVNGGAVATETTVSITVVGASGDLAKKKIFPALFALYYEGCLPKVGPLLSGHAFVRKKEYYLKVNARKRFAG